MGQSKGRNAVFSKRKQFINSLFIFL